MRVIDYDELIRRIESHIDNVKNNDEYVQTIYEMGENHILDVVNGMAIIEINKE